MKCEHCKKNEATCFYQFTNNGATGSLALCEACAAALQHGSAVPNPFSGFGADMSHLFDSLFGAPASKAPQNTKSCPTCGAVWRDISKSGRAFCADCYTTFGDELSPTLRSMHGAATHTGRAPAARRAVREKDEKLTRLRAELKEAITAENFEKAAELRDEIRALEKN